MLERQSLTLSLDDDALDVLAERVAEILSARGLADSPWRTAGEAAQYLRTSPKAVYQAKRLGKLRGSQPNGPGTKPLLFHVSELDAYARSEILALALT